MAFFIYYNYLFISDREMAYYLLFNYLFFFLDYKVGFHYL